MRELFLNPGSVTVKYDLLTVSAACDVSRKPTWAPVRIYLSDGFRQGLIRILMLVLRVINEVLRRFYESRRADRAWNDVVRSRHLTPFSPAFVLSADVSLSTTVPRFMSSVGLTSLPNSVFADLTSLVIL